MEIKESVLSGYSRKDKSSLIADTIWNWANKNKLYFGNCSLGIQDENQKDLSDYHLYKFTASVSNNNLYKII